MNEAQKIISVSPNIKQWKFLRSRAKRKSFIGGRGSGKSIAMGFQVGILFNDFPRATWVVAGLTYVQLDSVVIPSIRDSLEMMGYHEYDAKNCPYGVYTLGTQPPKNWIRPYKVPGKKAYQYCMTFINGFTIRFVSQDTQKYHRGLSIDGLLVDESATMSFEFIQTVLLPAFRGNENKLVPYKDHPLRYGFFDFSSASWTPEGNWIYDTEEKWKAMIDERAKMPPSQLKAIPPKYLFLESTYHDNQEHLPHDYGERLEDLLDPWKFEVEVLNHRVLKIPNAYYHAFTSSKHGYKDSYDYKRDDKSNLIWSSNDYHADRPLEVSFDFNTDICWLLVCQELSNEFRVINSEFAKPTVKGNRDKKLYIQLAETVCEKYAAHGKKEIFIYGDPNGNSTNAGTSNDNLPFFNEVSEVFKNAGWKVYRRELSSYPRYKDKYALVNTLFEERSERTPKIRINVNTNKALIIALQNTMVKTDKSFKKDKSSEDKARMREYATDGTDALDYILYAKYKNVMPSSGWSSTGIITLSR